MPQARVRSRQMSTAGGRAVARGVGMGAEGGASAAVFIAGHHPTWHRLKNHSPPTGMPAAAAAAAAAGTLVMVMVAAATVAVQVYNTGKRSEVAEAAVTVVVVYRTPGSRAVLVMDTGVFSHLRSLCARHHPHPRPHYHPCHHPHHRPCPRPPPRPGPRQPQRRGRAGG